MLHAARGSGSSQWFATAPQELQPPLQATLVARVLEPATRLATHCALLCDTATSSLGRMLSLDECGEEDLYRALGWLHQVQPAIERRLARRQLAGFALVLYDLTSNWLTGHCCELAAPGHSRESEKGGIMGPPDALNP